MAGKPKCLIKACDRPSKLRGLCPACYMAARRTVASKQATEKQLVERGMLLPAYHRPYGKFAVQFSKQE